MFVAICSSASLLRDVVVRIPANPHMAREGTGKPQFFFQLAKADNIASVAHDDMHRTLQGTVHVRHIYGVMRLLENVTLSQYRYSSYVPLQLT
jgi:hypothetical protein